MKKIASVLLTLLAALLWIASPRTVAGELIYSQYSDNQSTYGPSQLWPADGVNGEVADDFNLVANIDRVSAGGFVWGAANFQGVYVRFYAFGVDNKPGALQHEYFLPAGDPNLVWNAYGLIDATLSPAFTATGRHFLSVQPVSNYWYWWSSNSGAPRGEAFYFRDNSAGEGWHHGDNLNFNINADVVFDLYGTVNGAGVISGLSATILPRSGYLEIFGSNLGGSNGQVLIDGVSALVASWESTRIVAYVPETARLTTVPVQVVNASGQPSNTVDLTVTTRVSNGRVKWRFQAASMYILHRPAIGPDGTIVIHDSSGLVYALQADGALKWIFGTRVFAAGPPSIGLDGTVYVADSGTITALNPDGSLKWTFDEPQGGQGVIAGPTVGPDGNIYAVTDLGGLGALALSPAGQLLWSNTGDPVMAEYGQLGVEMSFGPSHSGGAVDQFYVTFDDFGSSERDHMYAFRLTGEQVWTIPLFMTKDTSGMMQQQRPVVGPDGTVFLSAAVATGGNWSLNAFNPASGTLLRSYFPSPGLGISVPTVGPDGAVYFGQSLSYLQAVSADFGPRWTFFDGSILSYPIVSPANDIVFTGGAPNYGVPGFVRAFSTSSGQLMWSLDLGVENGGNQNMESIPRFTPDGTTVYFGTAILGGNPASTFCFLYAIDATGSGAGTPTPTPTPTSTPVATPTPTPTPTLTPSPTPVSKAINLSTRMRVQTGDNVGIGGFIVTGSTPKHVLIRAIGPSLTGFGVPNALADPVLELHGPGAFAAITNDNWRATQEAEIQATLIPPTNDLESAIMVMLAPGAYTAIVRGTGNTPGVGLVEAYDLDQGVDSKLANLSTRAFVSTGDNIVIAGFMLGGNPPQAGDDRIVVRGIGPSLTAAGVSNALADPTLELRDTNGTLLISNNDWQENAVQAAEITAAGLAPTNNREAAIAATLPPGLYTALLAGRNNGTGIGLIEVYDRGGTP